MRKSFLLTCIMVIQLSVSAAPDIAPIIPQAGTVNNQSLEMLRQHQLEKQIEQDYKRFEERKDNGEAQKDEIEKKTKGEIIKAKPEEYATKGVYVELIIGTQETVVLLAELFYRLKH